MSDNTAFEHDFEASVPDEAAANLANELPVEGTLVAPEPVVADEAAADTEEDDFFAESAVEAEPVVDPNTLVTLVPSSSSNKFVPVAGPTPMIDLIARSGLQFAGDFTCFLNGAEIHLTDVVPGGSTVIIAGKVKGGTLA